MSFAESPSSSRPSDETLPAMDPEKNTDEPTDGNLSRQKSIAETLPLPREILFIAVVLLAQLTTQIGLGQGLSTLYIIGQHYGIINSAQLSWLIAGYSLTVGSFILISGRFGDMFGYKKMILIGFSWFALWSLVAGLAWYSNHVLFVFARVFQGIGPAITLPNGLALLGATYAPGRRKDMVFALFGATAPAGGILGLVFGALISLAWWPWVFFSFAIALFIITIVASYVIPDPPKRADVAQKSLREKLVALDLSGAVTGITALILFNFAWNQAPIVGWSKAYVYVCLILGILFAVAFFYVELKLAPEPLIPFEALHSDVLFILGIVACGWASFGIFFFYCWDFITQFRHVTPMLGAAQFSPVAISGVLASICTGLLLFKLGPQFVIIISLLFFLTGNILVGTMPVNQTYWAQTFVTILVMPWGMDTNFPAATIMLSNAVKKEHQGIAASLVATVVNYSISLGLGFAGTVEVYTNHGGKTQADRLSGVRHAFYMAIGLDGLGLILGLMFLTKTRYGRRAKTGTPAPSNRPLNDVQSKAEKDLEL